MVLSPFGSVPWDLLGNQQRPTCGGSSLPGSPWRKASTPRPRSSSRGPLSTLAPAARCPNAVEVTSCMSAADYDAIVTAIRGTLEGMASTCSAAVCPQADWAGSLVGRGWVWLDPMAYGPYWALGISKNAWHTIGR